MAFKQNPGRGNMLKTGRSIPPTLMTKSPMHQEDDSFELTERYNQGVDQMGEVRTSSKKTKEIGDKQGIEINPQTGASRAKGYEKQLKRSGNQLRIVDGSGKVLEEVTYNNASSDGGKAARELTKKFNRNRNSTNSKRVNNQTHYNITSGAKSPNDATEREKEILINAKKAIRPN